MKWAFDLWDALFGGKKRRDELREACDAEWAKTYVGTFKEDAMTEEKKTGIFDTERGEREVYLAALPDEPIGVPLTRDGFEALLERVCFDCELPVDDSSRQVLSHHVHSIPNDVDTSSVEKLCRVLRKALSNALTWGIDQEIKAKRAKALNEAHAEARRIAEAAITAAAAECDAPVPQESAQ